VAAWRLVRQRPRGYPQPWAYAVWGLWQSCSPAARPGVGARQFAGEQFRQHLAFVCFRSQPKY
jgi:hypothetical protein